MSKITCTLFLTACFSLAAVAQTSPSTSANAPANSRSAAEPTPATIEQTATAAKPVKDQSWSLLLPGTEDGNTTNRATAVRVFSLLSGERRAVTLARQALSDAKPPVRVAAAIALGVVPATSAIPKIQD